MKIRFMKREAKWELLEPHVGARVTISYTVLGEHREVTGDLLALEEVIGTGSDAVVLHDGEYYVIAITRLNSITVAGRQ